MVMGDISVVVPNECAMPCRPVDEECKNAQRHHDQTDLKARITVPLHQVATVFGGDSRNRTAVETNACALWLSCRAVVLFARLGNFKVGRPVSYLFRQSWYVRSGS